MSQKVRLWPMSLSKNWPESIWIGNKLGVCFSGGGGRAFTCALGQLRALHALGLWSNIDYVSAVSGGSWLACLATYTHLELSRLLGHLSSPSQLTMDYLTRPQDPLFVGHCIHHSFFHLLHAYQRSKDLSCYWSEVISQCFLKPYGLYHTHIPSYQGKRQQPGGPNSGAPFLIINATLLWPTDFFHTAYRQLFQWTPMYAGVLTKHQWGNHYFGGGFCELSGINSTLITREKHCAYVHTQPERLLVKMIASSSAFFASITDKTPCTRYWSPWLQYWPLWGDTQTRSYSLGDGAFIDNYGVIALLQRQVKRILVFINTSVPLTEPRQNTQGQWSGIDEGLPALFGMTPGGMTQVFPKKAFNKWVSQAKQCQHKGQALCVLQQLRVKANPFFQKPNTVGSKYFQKAKPSIASAQPSLPKR